MIDTLAAKDRLILDDRAPAPLTLECDGQFMYLRQHIKQMKLGLASTQWLYEALGEVVLGHFSEKIVLSDGAGVVLLTVLSDSKYLFILGTNTRFNFETDTGERMYNVLADILPILCT